MIFIEITTYGESVISTPRAEIGEPSGPMQNGTTYIVRPRMQPVKRPPSVSRISAGSTQLLVGPASASVSEQMKVRLSTRATSAGSDFGVEGVRALVRVELGQRAGVDELAGDAVPLLLGAVTPLDPVRASSAPRSPRPRPRAARVWSARVSRPGIVSATVIALSSGGPRVK